MNQIKVGSWDIEIDVNRTKEFYKNYHLITEECSCDLCANYVLACDIFSQDIMNIFILLGIDPRKEGEVSDYMKNEDGTHLYGGFYHIVGRIIKGPNLWVPTKKGSEVSSPTFVNYKGIEIGFSNDLELVPEDFPTPVIQFEFQMNVPWLLS